MFFFSLFVSTNLVMPTSQMHCATLSWAAWTRWRGAARILSPTAAASTQMLPNDWPSGSSFWRASSAVTWHDTWARSEPFVCERAYCTVKQFSFIPTIPLFLVSFCCSNEFSQLVASEYLSFFDFTGSSLDRALR